MHACMCELVRKEEREREREMHVYIAIRSLLSLPLLTLAQVYMFVSVGRPRYIKTGVTWQNTTTNFPVYCCCCFPLSNCSY